MARTYSGESARRLLNGVLGRVAPGGDFTSARVAFRVEPTAVAHWLDSPALLALDGRKTEGCAANAGGQPCRGLTNFGRS